MDSALVAQARNLSGENYSGSRSSFPSIKFIGRQSPYGEAGKYYILSKNKDTGNLDSALIGDTMEVTIIRVRKMLQNKEDGERKKFVYEFDSTAPGAMVVLKVGSNEPIQMSYQDVKKQHPDLKYYEVLYVAYAGKIAKLKVGGGSLGDFFAYLQSIPADDTVMRYKTTLGAKQVEHPKGAYFAMTFVRGAEDPNFPQVVEAVQKLTFPNAPEAKALPAGDAVDTSAEPAEDEINIEDIPF